MCMLVRIASYYVLHFRYPVRRFRFVDMILLSENVLQQKVHLYLIFFHCGVIRTTICKHQPGTVLANVLRCAVRQMCFVYRRFRHFFDAIEYLLARNVIFQDVLCLPFVAGEKWSLALHIAFVCCRFTVEEILNNARSVHTHNVVHLRLRVEVKATVMTRKHMICVMRRHITCLKTYAMRRQKTCAQTENM